VARFDEIAGTVEVAGLGNVTALVSTGSGEPKPLVLPAGVLGSAFRPIRPQVIDFAEGDVLVLHTDGVRGRLGLGSLRSMTPADCARAIVAAYGTPADDAGCVVAMGMALASRRPDAADQGDTTTLVARTPADADRCAAEARGFAARHGFTVMAQWQLGIATSELLDRALRGASEGLLTLTFSREPRESIVVEAQEESAQGSGPATDLGSIHRMMDRVALEPGPAGRRVLAWKHR
jgi:hypothetical protein